MEFNSENWTQWFGGLLTEAKLTLLMSLLDSTNTFSNGLLLVLLFLAGPAFQLVQIGVAPVKSIKLHRFTSVEALASDLQKQFSLQTLGRL